MSYYWIVAVFYFSTTEYRLHFFERSINRLFNLSFMRNENRRLADAIHTNAKRWVTAKLTSHNFIPFISTSNKFSALQNFTLRHATYTFRQAKIDYISWCIIQVGTKFILGGHLTSLAEQLSSEVRGLVIALVWPKAPFWKNDQAFQSILGSTSRIIIASFAAYLISQLHDVWATRELAEKVNAFIDRRFGHPW